MSHLSSRASLATAVAGAALLVSACSGGGGDTPGGSGASPEQVLATAKTNLDQTSGVKITLSTENLPDATMGIEKADGIGTHAPAFDGSITVRVSGNSFQVPVVAVDDKVYAQLPLTSGFSEIDPADYKSPDPAKLLSTDSGFSSLLPATTGVAAGDTVRGGTDNKEVLTSYTGTVPDTAAQNIIPSATGDFDATYTVDSAGDLRSVDLTGDFYGAAAGALTYTIGFDDYGTVKDITAP